MLKKDCFEICVKPTKKIGFWVKKITPRHKLIEWENPTLVLSKKIGGYMKIEDYGEFKFLKSLEEYKKELLELHQEVGYSIATDTLIKSDLDSVRRWEELIIIICFLEGNLKEVKNETTN